MPRQKQSKRATAVLCTVNGDLNNITCPHINDSNCKCNAHNADPRRANSCYFSGAKMTLVYDQSAGLLTVPTGTAQNYQPVDPCTLPAYTPVRTAFGVSTALPDMDFETYSEAGFIWRDDLNKWKNIDGASKGGLFVVGAPAYSEHPSTEVLSLAYNLKDGTGRKMWLPCMPPPVDLFDHIVSGGLIEAHNSMFEWLIWNNVAVKKLGWPPLPLKQLRCSMSKVRAFGLPGALGKAGFILKLDQQKNKDGTRLLNKFSRPRNPTKNNPARRLDPMTDPDGPKLYQYNDQDIVAETELSTHAPDLIQSELELWLIDQRINARGCQLDVESVHVCIALFEQAAQRYNAELAYITNGVVTEASKHQVLQAWLAAQGVHLENMQAGTIDDAVGKLPDGPAKRALEIRAIVGSASVKKLYAMRRMVSYDGRVRDMFNYCGAERTGRASGQGPQPQNLPSGGPDVIQCDPTSGCGAFYSAALARCPACGTGEAFANHAIEWGADAAGYALSIIHQLNLDKLMMFYGDPVKAISGCLRSFFIAAPGHDLICSDYSAIEAVCLAALAGEEWRLEVFRTHGMIYEMSASKMSGVPLEEFKRHKKETGNHHPLRKKLGKVGELAGGYQGGYGAWCNFGADKFMTEEEIRANVKRWREESPAIVAFWYGVERCAIAAVEQPGTMHTYRDVAYTMKDDALFCRLPSGRLLTYHQPRLEYTTNQWGRRKASLSYLGTDVQGRVVRLDTYGGKLTENITQAVARDILAHALINLERAGYPVVLHVHDEIVSEVPHGFGSVPEFEAIMVRLPDWCRDWPIKAAGGWRGKRYRKD